MYIVRKHLDGWVKSSNYCDRFFSLVFFFFFLIICICLWYIDSHPASPQHTRRLKSQHHEIITTFLFSTPHHEHPLGGRAIPPVHSPPLMFILLGFLLSGLMDFVFFLIMFPLATPLLLCLA